MKGSPYTFQTSSDTLQAVFGTEYRSRELQPMFETSDTSSIASSSAVKGRMRNSSVGSLSHGYDTRETTYSGQPQQAWDNEDQIDGFDPDDAFGPSSSTRFTFPGAQDTSNQDSQESATTRGTATTLAARMNKRTFAGEEGPSEAGDNERDDYDEEMALTDIEDEIHELPRMSFNAPIGRTLAGRRGLAKTQSLPAEVFKGEMSF
ncbi:hypothetical protein OIO90_000201 [Microbotryomycetes sp. JL221]|nr:hypothetical protein OIO90_000201 [Microbotryomycetes sp. JL221]